MYMRLALVVLISIFPLQTHAQSLNARDLFDIGNNIIQRTRETAPTPSPQRGPPQQAGKGVSGAPTYDARLVRKVQSALLRLGYAPGPADGLMGPRTKRAIRRFQRDNGLRQTGVPSSVLLSRLNAGTVDAQPTAQTAHPSFDCAHAGTATEHAICGSVALAQKDRQIAALYKDALAQSRLPGDIRARQRAWIEERDRCSGSETCLAHSMDTRIAELGGTSTDVPNTQRRTTPSVGSAVAAGSGFSPSFDCAKAGNPSERAICGSAKLAALDRRLADVHRLKLTEVPDPGMTRADQSEWIAKRNDKCGPNETCLRIWMQHRIVSLNGAPTAAASPASRSDGANTATTASAPASAPAAAHGQIDRGLYIVEPKHLKHGSGSYTVIPGCLSREEVRTVDDAVDAAIGANGNIAEMSFHPRDMTVFLDYDDTYLLIAGDCLEKFKFAAEGWNGGVAPDLKIITVMEPTVTTGGPAPASKKELELAASPEALPLLRIYLPQYLANSSPESRLKVLQDYISGLQGSANDEQVFSTSEIHGRDVEFFAHQNLYRWDSALKALEVDPPVTVKTRVELTYYEYDFDKRALVFPGQKQTNRDGVPHLLSPAFRNGHVFYPANRFQHVPDKGDNYLLKVLADSVMPPFALIDTDRKALLPDISMPSEQAERYKLGNVRVVADIFYRIDGVGQKADDGKLIYKGALQGVEIFTDTGDRLASYAPEDLPLAVPKKVENETVAKPEPKPTPQGTDARNLSVIGIKLGMPLNQALTKVRKKGEIIYRADVEPKVPERVQDRYSLVALDSGETIALHFADESGKPVIGIARSIPVQDNVPVGAIRKAFVDAYGEPTFSNGAQDVGGGDITWRWELPGNVNSEGVECAELFDVFGAGVRGKVVHEKKNIEALQATFANSGRAASYDDGYFFRFYTKDRWPRVTLSRQSNRGDCRPFLNTTVRPINDRTFVWVHLVDLAALQKELSKVLSTKKPGTFDADLLR